MVIRKVISTDDDVYIDVIASYSSGGSNKHGSVEPEYYSFDEIQHMDVWLELDGDKYIFDTKSADMYLHKNFDAIIKELENFKK